MHAIECNSQQHSVLQRDTAAAAFTTAFNPKAVGTAKRFIMDEGDAIDNVAAVPRGGFAPCPGPDAGDFVRNRGHDVSEQDRRGEGEAGGQDLHTVHAIPRLDRGDLHAQDDDGEEDVRRLEELLSRQLLGRLHQAALGSVRQRLAAGRVHPVEVLAHGFVEVALGVGVALLVRVVRLVRLRAAGLVLLLVVQVAAGVLLVLLVLALLLANVLREPLGVQLLPDGLALLGLRGLLQVLQHALLVALLLPGFGVLVIVSLVVAALHRAS